jgi:hypothetical protein
MERNIYLFHQTPVALAQTLLKRIPLEPNDILYEPFKGEGAFYDHFPEGHPKEWSEVEQGRDYRDHLGEYDWVITNPPFRLETGKGRVNSIWLLLDYFSERARKGIAFLCNDNLLSTLTPIRIKKLEQRGFAVESITVCNVKRWRGRYFFVVIRKGAVPCLTGLVGTY